MKRKGASASVGEGNRNPASQGEWQREGKSASMAENRTAGVGPSNAPTREGKGGREVRSRWRNASVGKTKKKAD